LQQKKRAHRKWFYFPYMVKTPELIADLEDPVHGEFVILHRDRHLEQTAAMVPPNIAGGE
jgi:hypothetical protein